MAKRQDQVYKARKEAKKLIEVKKPGLEEKVSALRKKQQEGKEPLNFHERNLLNIYNRSIEKHIARSLK